jgi:hypothetical protein
MVLDAAIADIEDDALVPSPHADNDAARSTARIRTGLPPDALSDRLINRRRALTLPGAS